MVLASNAGISWREHRTTESVLEEAEVENQLMNNVAQLNFRFPDAWRAIDVRT